MVASTKTMELPPPIVCLRSNRNHCQYLEDIYITSLEAFRRLSSSPSSLFGLFSLFLSLSLSPPPPPPPPQPSASPVPHQRLAIMSAPVAPAASAAAAAAPAAAPRAVPCRRCLWAMARWDGTGAAPACREELCKYPLPHRLP